MAGGACRGRLNLSPARTLPAFCPDHVPWLVQRGEAADTDDTDVVGPSGGAPMGSWGGILRLRATLPALLRGIPTPTVLAACCS
jgi:hypothetical protein